MVYFRRFGRNGAFIAFDPPCPISFDGELRIILASDVFKQGERSITITLTLPGETAFLAKQTDLDRLARTLAGPVMRLAGELARGVDRLSEYRSN